MAGTNRALRARTDVDRLTFGDDGLLPVVAQDASSGAVLMVAFANRDAIERTLQSGFVHFWSRSRGQLWKKGETSGNTLALESLHADCDGDTLLARVRPSGPACHTGETTCFGEGAGAEGRGESLLERLDRTLRQRARERPEGSYTVRLLDDPNLRLKKLGEETAELIAALAVHDADRSVEEAADLVYHLLVALRAEEIGISAVAAALEARAR